ncbi:hypothetical protein C7212DRAFT_344475 [Tuber magnatum]|uniref:Uncharacterized protein n=1 Tax=Tuber magnatum TaxID=42249 RepID=A0A317SNE3_9PEZI|nr:hypothetical protein C7212DRAFT_344475 [Tuber magnatum]
MESALSVPDRWGVIRYSSTRVQGIMKQTDTCEQNPRGVRHRETTRDERNKVITLLDYSGWNWLRIGRELNIDRSTCRRNNTPSNHRRSGWPPIFDNTEKQRLEAFVTRDARTRRLS